MEKVNIALDVFCIIICLFLLLHPIRRNASGKENRYFLLACAFNITMILGDLSDWCCNGLAQPWYPAALHIGQFIYYTSVPLLMLSVWKYVAIYLSAYTTIPKVCHRILYLLAAVHLIGCILTPFTGMYYVITADNIYQRGNLVFIASLIPICTYLFILFFTLKNRKAMSFHVFIALLSNVWLPMLGHLILNLFRGIGALNPCITLALLLVFLNIQMDKEIEYERNKRKLDQAQMTLMLSQIKPHFLYNSLTAIRRLCEVDPTDAREAINDFALFLRTNMYAISDSLPIPFEQELLHTKSYLQLEQRRFEDALNVVYALETTNFCLPALTLQPIVENAVLHGIRKKDGGGTVRIHTAEEAHHFIITVADDGAGFQPDTITNRENIGLNNVSKRLQILCGGKLQIDSSPGQGTTVTILIPKERDGQERGKDWLKKEE